MSRLDSLLSKPNDDDGEAPAASVEQPVEPADTVSTVQFRMPAPEARTRTEQYNVRIDAEIHDAMKKYIDTSGNTMRKVTEEVFRSFLQSIGAMK